MKAKLKYALPFSPFIVVIASYLYALYLGACDICHDMGWADGWGSICGDTGGGYLFLLTTVMLLPSAIIITSVWLIVILRRFVRRKKRNE